MKTEEMSEECGWSQKSQDSWRRKGLEQIIGKVWFSGDMSDEEADIVEDMVNEWSKLVEYYEPLEVDERIEIMGWDYENRKLIY